MLTAIPSKENPTGLNILIYSVDKVPYLTVQAVRRCKKLLTLPCKKLLDIYMLWDIGSPSAGLDMAAGRGDAISGDGN